MKRTIYLKALELAENLSYKVSPRPPVAAIVSYKGEVIGEGVTTIDPLIHAEINAIDDAQKKLESLEIAFYTALLSHVFIQVIQDHV